MKLRATGRRKILETKQFLRRFRRHAQGKFACTRPLEAARESPVDFVDNASMLSVGITQNPHVPELPAAKKYPQHPQQGDGAHEEDYRISTWY